MTELFSRDCSPKKRELSLEEKSSLINFSGKAVILPGGCGSTENPLELEELLMAGYNEEQIIGFEKDAYMRKRLEAYYPRCYISGDINKSVDSIERSSVSYLHLDFMRSVTQHTFSKAKYFSSILDNDARFRITVSSNWGRGAPRGNYHLSCVRNLAYDIFIPMCKRYGVNPFKVAKVEKEVRKFFREPDSQYTLIQRGEGDGAHAHIGLAMFLFCAFGLRTARNFSDPNVMHEAKLQISNANKQFLYIFLSDISRFQYRKSSDVYGTTMYTTWFNVQHQKTEIISFLNQICDLILEPMDVYDHNSE